MREGGRRWAGPRVMHLRALLLHPGVPCGLCGAPIDTPASGVLDHITPRSRGGSDDIDNLTPAHRWCNATKGAGVSQPEAPPAVIAHPARSEP